MALACFPLRTRRIGAVAPPALGPDSGLIGPEWGDLSLWSHNFVRSLGGSRSEYPFYTAYPSIPGFEREANNSLQGLSELE